MTNLSDGGDEILVVISGKLKQIILGELAPTLLIISERLWRRQFTIGITD
jgi:hypothetical protein